MYQLRGSVSGLSHACEHRSHRSQRTPQRFLHLCRIQNGSTGMKVPSLPFALGPMERRQQECPGAFKAQAPEMVEDRLPRREVGWEVAPGAARAQHVEDGIKNGARGVNWWPATFGQGRKIVLHSLPFCIGKIAWVTGSHPLSLSRERPSPISKTPS